MSGSVALGPRPFRAVLRSCHVSPIKANLVLALLPGLKVSDALLQLQFSRKRVAVLVSRLLRSAIANAENNHGADIDRLVVEEAFATKAFLLKRSHARARGRGTRVCKYFAHMTILLTERVGE
jgi:large subunit ribosomal protein L22